MKKNNLLTIVLIFITFIGQTILAQNEFTTPYGNNKDVGKYVRVNGTKIYYEEYGKGEPLLIIHSCGTDINAMEFQIEYFKKSYRVIAADSRGQGKSKLKTKELTYDLMAEDLEGLIKHLKLDNVNILGWSDGGIIALKMAINNKVKVKKVVAMGANLRPDKTAVNTWAYNQVREMKAKTLKMIEQGDKTKDWKRELQLDNLLVNQPNIKNSELKKIKAPVLVMIGDRGIIRNEHAVEIFNNLPKSQLCIMPGFNHGAPRSSSKTFNQIVDRFLSESFNYSEFSE